MSRDETPLPFWARLKYELYINWMITVAFALLVVAGYHFLAVPRIVEARTAAVEQELREAFDAFAKEFYYMARFSACESFASEMSGKQLSDPQVIDFCLGEAAYRIQNDAYGRQQLYGWDWEAVQAAARMEGGQP